jgi:hypothetical protein
LDEWEKSSELHLTFYKSLLHSSHMTTSIILDTQDIAQMVKDYLKKMGYESLTAPKPILHATSAVLNGFEIAVERIPDNSTPQTDCLGR